MNIRRLAVVVNPRGGKRNGIQILDRVRHVFDSAQIELEIRVTERAGHATEIARNLDLQQLGGICVVGGDGTFHEVANGLMQRDDSLSVPLGIIPAGTGNSLAQHLNCQDPIEAARRVVAGRSQSLDVVQVTLQDYSVHCINIIGWGAVSDINCTAEKMRFLGPTRYTISALRHILAPKVRRATLVLDDRTITDDFLFVIACNTKYTGAGMKLAPNAEMGDGKIDVVVIRRVSRWQMLRLFMKVFDGSHVAMSCIEFHQVSSFSIQSESADRMNLDGEMTGNSPMTATLLPSALSIFVK